MVVRVLGPIEVDGVSLPLRERQVLGVLVVRGRGVATRDDFAEALWGGRPPATARKVVQGCVVRLRRVLGSGAILTQEDGYRLGAKATTDAASFEHLYAEAVVDVSAGHAQRAVDALDAALGLWRGAPLAELAGWPPGESEAARWEALRDSALDQWLVALRDAGHAARAADEGASAVAATPLREARWLAWAQSLYSAGRSADALAALSQLRHTLAEVLGVDPIKDVADLERAILRHDSSLSVPNAIAPDARSPWPGLVAYEIQDADYYFGRDDEVAACVARLRAPGARLVVVGASGAGKSSFLRAGICAALIAEGKSVAIIPPGTSPPEKSDVLVVDQLEQVLAIDVEGDVVSGFLDELVRAPQAVAVAVRADKLDALCAFASFARLLQSGMTVLGPLDAAGRRTVIEGPATAARVRLEPGLIDVVLADTGDDAGVLPMLSHALAETWSHAEGNTLTVDGYRRSGGLRRAVATSAEALFARLSHDERAGTRNLLRRLVSEDGDLRRSTAPLDVADRELVEKLLAARLVTATDEGELQLAHEALIRGWPRLSDWIGDDKAGRRLLRTIAHDAGEWIGAGESPANLYRGTKLQAALEWSQQHSDELTEDERRFLDRAAEEADRALRSTRRQNRRLRVAVAASAALLIAAIGGGGLAIKGLVDTEDARAATERALAASEALRVGTLAGTQRDASTALALTAQALALDDSQQIRILALEVFGRFANLLGSNPTATATGGAAASATGPARTVDGSYSAVADGPSVSILDADHRRVRVIDNLPTTPEALIFDHSGTRLAGALNEVGFPDVGTVFVWNVATGIELMRFTAADGPIASLRFGDDDDTVITVGGDDTRTWDLTGSQAVVRLQSAQPTAFHTSEQTLSLWDESVDGWQTLACRLAGRPLSESDWKTMIGASRYDPAC